MEGLYNHIYSSSSHTPEERIKASQRIIARSTALEHTQQHSATASLDTPLPSTVSTFPLPDSFSFTPLPPSSDSPFAAHLTSNPFGYSEDFESLTGLEDLNGSALFDSFNGFDREEVGKMLGLASSHHEDLDLNARGGKRFRPDHEEETE